MNEDEISALHVLALIPIDVCVRGECNGMDWTRRYTEDIPRLNTVLCQGLDCQAPFQRNNDEFL